MTSTPKPRPVFIAALRREIAAVVKGQGWHVDHSRHARNIHVYVHEDAILACAGMGAARASLAIEAALALGPASELVSVGWAGACDPQFHVGDVIQPSILIDARTGERFFQVEPATTEAAKIVVSVSAPAGAATTPNSHIRAPPTNSIAAPTIISMIAVPRLGCSSTKAVMATGSTVGPSESNNEASQA